MKIFIFSFFAFGQEFDLHKALTLATKHNLRLAIDQKQYDLADANYRQQLSLLSPKLSFVAEYTRNEDEIIFDMGQNLTLPEFPTIPGFDVPELSLPDPIIIQPLQIWNWRASLSQPLFRPSLPFLIIGSKHQRNAVNLDNKSTRRNIHQQVVNQYYQAYIYTRLETLNAEFVALAKQRVTLARAEESTGKISASALMAAQLDFAKSKHEYQTTKAQQQQAVRLLGQLIGRKVVTKLHKPPLQPLANSKDKLLLQTLKNHESLLAAEQRTQSLSNMHRANQLNWLPTIDTHFVYSYGSNTAFTDKNLRWLWTTQLQWNIWQGGKLRQQRRTTAIQLSIIQLQHQQIRQQLVERIHQQWDQLLVLKSKLVETQKHLELAALNHKSAEQQLASGHMTQLQERNAGWLLKQANFLHLSTKMNYERAIALLYLLSHGEIKTGKPPMNQLQ